MKNMIDIDATSFFRSGFARLAWAITEQTDNGTMYSTQQESLTDESNIREAIKEHMDNITSAIQRNGDLMDYELTLLFDDHIDEEKKEQFTAIFNEYNTRDEPS